MSFSQWARNFSGASNFFSLEFPGILGDSSLQVGTTSTGANQAQAVYLSTASGLTRGITRGRIITLIRYKTAHTSDAYCGLFCMGSSLTTATVGALYAVELEVGTTNNVTLKKVTSGGIQQIELGTQIGSTYSVDFDTLDDTVSIQLDWDAENQGFYGGTQLKLGLGTSTDFSDLTIVATEVDSTSPITVSTVEGLYTLNENLSAGMRVQFDQTTIFVSTS
jgi:hypothetical protein